MSQNSNADISHELFQIVKRFLRLDLKLKSIDGLKRSEQELLVMLAMNFEETKKELTVTEISNHLQITPAGVTQLLNPLEEAGYIERMQAPRTDRRIVRIRLTDKGTRNGSMLIATAQEKMVELVDLLGEEDSQKFIKMMTLAIELFSK